MGSIKETIANSATKPVTPFQKLVRELAGQAYSNSSELEGELRQDLGRIVDPAHAGSTYNKISKAIKFTRKVRTKRGTLNTTLIDADPLAITRAFGKLAAFAKAHHIQDSHIDEATILAAILYPVLRFRRSSEFDSIDPDDAKLIRKQIERIGGEDKPVFRKNLGDTVQKLVLDTLKLSEINLGGQVAYPNSPMQAQSEDRRTKLFWHMLEELDLDPRAILIRGTQWFIHMQQLTQMYAEKENLTPHDIAKIERCAELTEKVYIPLASAYGHRVLKEVLDDQLLKMTNAEAYQQREDATTQLLRDGAPEGKEVYVQDLRSGEGLVLQHVKETIEEKLRSSGFLKTHLVTIEGRIKRPASTQRKIEKKGSADDIAAFMVIVDTGTDGDTPARVETEEHKASLRAYKALVDKRNTLGITKKEAGPGEEDDFDDYFRKPKPGEENFGHYERGYRAVHDTLVLKTQEEGNPRTIEFEIQITGKAAHENNTHGTAAHGRYKDLPTGLDENIGHTVSVFDAGKRIVQVSLPGTAADFIALRGLESGDPDLPFKVSRVDINRTLHLYDPSVGSPDQGLRTPLAPGDHVSLSYDEIRLYSAKERERIIGACAVPEMRAFLERRDEELSRRFGGKRPGTDTGLPPEKPYPR